MFKKQPKSAPDARTIQQNRCNGAKISLLMILLFTVINCLMAFMGSDRYFLFSAMIPYFLVLTGGLETGKIVIDGIVPEAIQPMSVLYVLLGVASC